jgi:hypothetical protein
MLTKILIGFTAGLVGLFSACGIALLQGGIATVYVEEGDFWIYVPVPVTAVEVALNFVPEPEIAEVRRELEEAKEILPAVLEALRECPDAVFVEVESGDDRVWIEKRNGSLIIKVRSSDDTNVHVRVPIRGACRVVEKVADI